MTNARVVRLAAVLLAIPLAACAAGSDCGESVALAEHREPSFFATPEVRHEGSRRVVVPAVEGALQVALREARPGDVIELAPGTHPVGRGEVAIRTSGSPDRWIRIGGAAGTRPVVDLRDRTEFRIAASYVVLENVEIVHGRGNNVHVAPSKDDISNVIVRDCTVRALARGPGAAVKVNRNNPNGSAVERVYVERCDLSEAIDNAVVDGVGVAKVVVRGNYIHDNDAGSSGVFFKGGSSDVLIEGNLVARIRGNSAVKLGGSTGHKFFDPAHADQEGVDQIARNNFVVDCDDSVFEIRGTRGCRIYHNTVVSQTGFAIFRLQSGNTASGRASTNDEVEIVNNLIVATGGDPQFARNDTESGNFRFRANLWVGTLHNPDSAGPGIPRFPCSSDIVVTAAEAAGVLRSPTFEGIDGLADALERFVPLASGPAAGAGAAQGVAARDAASRPRPATAPTIGALEPR